MKTITEQQAREMFDNYLDGFKVRHPATNLKFPGSYALKRLDGLAYEAYFEDYIDSLLDSKTCMVEGYTDSITEAV